MSRELLSEIKSIRSIMGLLNEDVEMASQSSDLSKIQNLSKLEGIDVDVKNILDKTNPICEPPKTGNEKHDNIIKKVWDWASDPSNKPKLKETFSKLKDAVSQSKKQNKTIKEQGGVGIVIAGITITPGILIIIGVTLLIILIVKMIPTKSNCKKWKTVDDLV